jgi:hypothetical protein
MRYPYHSWNDVDRTLEAFRYARRSLLVVLAAALPFAAWEAVTPVPGAEIAPIEVRAGGLMPAAEVDWPATIQRCEGTGVGLLIQDVAA